MRFARALEEAWMSEREGNSKDSNWDDTIDKDENEKTGDENTLENRVENDNNENICSDIDVDTCDD